MTQVHWNRFKNRASKFSEARMLPIYIDQKNFNGKREVTVLRKKGEWLARANLIPDLAAYVDDDLVANFVRR